MICKVVIILLSTLIFLANCVKCYKNQNEDFEFIEDEPNSHFDQNAGKRDFQEFSYDDDESENTEIFETLYQCKPCGLVNHTTEICGSDGKTYESICQLNLTNCLNKSNIKISCENSCPCKEKKFPKFKGNKLYLLKKQRYYKDLEPKFSKQFQKHKTEPIENSELNEVYVERKYQNDNCKNVDAMKSMGIRLLEWFTVLMNDPLNSVRLKHIRINHQFPKYCKHEVKWMFDYLDSNSNGLLEPTELRDLENYPFETCLKPFLLSCDFNVDARVSIKEWCRCFVSFDRKFFNQNIDNSDYFDNDDENDFSSGDGDAKNEHFDDSGDDDGNDPILDF